MNTVSKFACRQAATTQTASARVARALSSAAPTRPVPPALSRKAAGPIAIVIATFAVAAGPRASAADATPPTATAIPVAHSALLTIDATPSGDSLSLRIRHVANQLPIDGKDVTVAVDGKNEPVTAGADGTFNLATKDLAGDGERTLDIVVAHDGIREILTGKLTVPKASSVAADMWRDHKQIAWWVLNIGIVLLAAIMFSRRTST